MNRNTYKKVRKHADLVLLEWVKTLVPEEAQDEISIDNINDYLPDNGHFSTDGGNRVRFYTRRWTIRTIKKLIGRGYELNNITMRDLESVQRKN